MDMWQLPAKYNTGETFTGAGNIADNKNQAVR